MIQTINNYFVFGVRLNVDFVSHHGVISCILKMGGQKDLVLGLAVTLYKGTYHLRTAKNVTTDPGRAQPTQFNEGIRPKEGASQAMEASSRLLLKFVTSSEYIFSFTCIYAFKIVIHNIMNSLF